MAAVNFPNSPSVNDTHTSSGSTWKWDGTVWQRLGEAGAQGSQGHQGRQGAGGAAGAQGAQGVQGANGAVGAQGATGAQGVQGAANATTISNNANNKVITGSDSANVLRAESDFTWDNSTSILSVGNQLVRIGSGNAGQNSGSRSTTVGNYCGQSSGGYSVNVGGNAVGNSAGGYSVNVGGNSVGSGAGQYSINIGGNAVGYSNPSQYSINIGGQYAGYSNAGEHCINIGYSAGYNSGGKYGVNIGYSAGHSQGSSNKGNVAIGYHALKHENGNEYCVGIGNSCYLPIKGENTGASDNQLVIGVGHTAWIVGTKNYNVGLGVTNPFGPLEVQRNGVPAIIANYNNSKHLQMGAGGSGAGLHVTDGNFFTINHQPYANRGSDNNLTERFRVDSTGNIHLRSATTNRIVLGSSGGAVGSLTNNENWIRGSGNMVQLNTAGGDYGFEVLGDQKMKLDTSGNLELRSATQCRVTFGSAGGSGNDTNWIRGDGDKLMYNCRPNGKFEWEIGGTLSMSFDSDGVKFNGDTSSANALDDYEEGLYNPSLTCSSGGGYNLSSSYNTMAYRKIGSLVHIQGYIAITSESGTPSGTLRISLPFAATALQQNADYTGFKILIRNHGSNNMYNQIAVCHGGGSYFNVLFDDGDGASTYVTHAYVDTDWQFFISGSYIAG